MYIYARYVIHSFIHSIISFLCIHVHFVTRVSCTTYIHIYVGKESNMLLYEQLYIECICMYNLNYVHTVAVFVFTINIGNVFPRQICVNVHLYKSINTCAPIGRYTNYTYMAALVVYLINKQVQLAVIFVIHIYEALGKHICKYIIAFKRQELNIAGSSLGRVRYKKYLCVWQMKACLLKSNKQI